jgi:hypothetical protein
LSAQESAWREDHPRVANGAEVLIGVRRRATGTGRRNSHVRGR